MRLPQASAIIPTVDLSSTSSTRKQRGGATRLETSLRWTLLLIVILIMVGAGYFVLRVFQERSAPPRNYYDFQLRLWKDTLAKNPKSPDVHTTIGYLYLKKGDTRRGLGYLKSALKLDAKFTPALYNLGVHYKDVKDYDRALDYLGKAAQYSKEDRYLAYYTLGEVYEELGKTDKALKSYETSAGENGTMWNTAYKLGQIYEKKGNFTKSLEYYERAALFNPNNDRLNEAIARLKKKGSGS